VRAPGLPERPGRPLQQLGPTSRSGARWPLGHGPGSPTCTGAVGGLRGGGSKFHSIAHSRHRTYPEAERDAGSLRLQGRAGGGGHRHSAAATTARGRGCAGPLSAARRPPPNFAQRQHGTASPCLASQARLASPRVAAGRQGLAPSYRSPTPPPAHAPLPGRTAGRNRAPGPELRRGGGRRSYCDVSSLRGYLYPHDWISFMKPGPGVSVLWDAGGKGASALRRAQGPWTNMRRA
jgi:hypothetical protein